MRCSVGFLGEVTICNLAAETRFNCKTYLDEAEAKGLTMTVDLPESPIYVRIDRQGYRLILSNLISNAIKYTPAGSVLSGHSRRLIDLAEVGVACTADAPRHVGMRTVPIDQIRGSQGRSNDFDRDSNPLQARTRNRWLGIARARRQGQTMPPVDLIRVRDVYFVQDGHHRISVARALGQLDIEADVTVWQVTGPLPWERSTTGRSRTGQGVEIGRLLRRARAGSNRLFDRFLMNLRVLSTTVGIKLGEQIAAIGASGSSLYQEA
jgi:hypothetical protein